MFYHLSILLSFQPFFTKEPVNLKGRNEFWVSGEGTTQGGLFALLDCEVGRVLNHPCSLQNNQVLKRDNDIGEGILQENIPESVLHCPARL